MPLLLSLKVAAWASAITAVAGIGLGWLLARKPFAGRELLDTLLTLPPVLPPAVLGYYLLVRRRSARGQPCCRSFPSTGGDARFRAHL